jgi:hypothetical protein
MIKHKGGKGNSRGEEVHAVINELMIRDVIKKYNEENKIYD